MMTIENIVNLAINHDITNCVQVTYKVLTEEDPFTKYSYKLAKTNIDIALNIMEHISEEGDKLGAIQRILTHLETAKKIISDVYIEKASKSPLVDPKKFVIVWCETGEAKELENSIVKITLFQLVFHTIIGSSEALLVKLIEENPNYYTFSTHHDFCNQAKRMISEDEWSRIEHERAKGWCTAINDQEMETIPGMISSMFLALKVFLGL